MKRFGTIAVFLVAICIALFALFIQIAQYKSLNPTISTETPEEDFQIPIFPDDPILGDRKAPITMILFEDMGCTACAAFHQTFLQYESANPGKIKLIVKGVATTQFPVSSEPALRYAFCAHKQKAFQPFVTTVFQTQQDLSTDQLDAVVEGLDLNANALQTCLASTETNTYVERNMILARVLEIQQLPTLFYEDKQISTPQSVDAWQRYVQAILQAQ
jgi:protein-disulfide isomerase